MPTIEIEPNQQFPTHCEGDACHDEVFMQGLISRSPGCSGKQGSKLVAFHLMGSHGSDLLLSLARPPIASSCRTARAATSRTAATKSW